MAKRLPVLVQIGAHTHEGHSHSRDPGKQAVRSGYRAILVEPMPQYAATLRKMYQGWSSVSVIEAALCDKCDEQRRLYHVDLSSTRNLGSERSDPRCAPDWVAEIPSFDRQHVLKHQAMISYVSERSRNNKCQACAKRINRTLTANCSNNVIVDNLISIPVKCACFEQLLQGISAVDVLMIDAEGYDADVLRAFPFERVRARKVFYEPYHLNRLKASLATHVLRRHGYVMVKQHGWTMVEWKYNKTAWNGW
jgi:hypothetical protein